MNFARRLFHSLLFAAGLYAIVCGILFLLKKDLWYCDAAALCICFMIGFFVGTFDKRVDEPSNWVADDPEENEKLNE